MNLPGKPRLAGAGFAEKQNRVGAVGILLTLETKGLHDGTLTENRSFRIRQHHGASLSERASNQLRQSTQDQTRYRSSINQTSNCSGIACRMRAQAVVPACDTAARAGAQQAGKTTSGWCWRCLNYGN